MMPFENMNVMKGSGLTKIKLNLKFQGSGSFSPDYPSYYPGSVMLKKSEQIRCMDGVS